MKRDIFKQLVKWKNSERRKPLLLMGARQVGKTYILKHFGDKEYQKVIYLNFENSPQLKGIFEASKEPLEILKLIKIDQGVEVEAQNTLLIFDEIQECPDALNSLKYFEEHAHEYHVCAAGSLLGVKLAHTKGFPVGKVNFLNLYPLSFFEFLSAIGEEDLRLYLQSVEKLQGLPESIHIKSLSLMQHYYYIGGMPEAVFEYVKTEDFLRVREVQNEILKAYQLDFVKHAPSDQVMRISQVWDSIPAQFAKENRKFIYSVVRKGARAKDFEIALQWLMEAGLIMKVSLVSKPAIPLKAYANFEFFKVFLLDVGLLGAMTGLSAQILISGHQLFQEFKGAYTENYIAQTLSLSNEALFYWGSEGTAEVDFLIEDEGGVYPLEIKSGTTNKKKSLRVYDDKYHPAYCIRSSPMNLTLDNNLLNCPLYLFEFLGQLQKIKS